MTVQPAGQEEPAEQARFVAHLPFAAPDLDEAKRYARMLARTLAHLPEVDAAEATVSEDGNPAIHYRLICDRRLDNGAAAFCAPTTRSPAPPAAKNSPTNAESDRRTPRSTLSPRRQLTPSKLSQDATVSAELLGTHHVSFSGNPDGDSPPHERIHIYRLNSVYRCPP